MKVFHSSIHRECVFMQLNSMNFKVLLATFKHIMYFWEKTLRESREGKGGGGETSQFFFIYILSGFVHFKSKIFPGLFHDFQGPH